ncbi:MAG: hypothetical protein IPO92_18575 [Saprospiraceae bacterium]|nr:hypothetical protein [Saprospiraceae bacterium]
MWASGDLQSCLAGVPDIISESTINVGLPPVLQTKWNALKKPRKSTRTIFNNTQDYHAPINHICQVAHRLGERSMVSLVRLNTYKHIEISHWGTFKDTSG